MESWAEESVRQSVNGHGFPGLSNFGETWGTPFVPGENWLGLQGQMRSGSCRRLLTASHRH